ncbi:MAG: hypothetical protein EBQ96_03820 [Proteobacteria bacterium]|nr:hypothetical protein [Pseudomonadota bacterium]
MTFSFVAVPSVRDRVNEAFTSMRLAPENFKNLYSFLLFSFSETLGMDGDGNRARAHDDAITPRLENIVRAVLEASNFANPSRPLSEELLTAIAMRDTPDLGLKGTAMLSKYPEAEGFLANLKHVYSGFRRVNDEPIPSVRAYRSAGPDAQFLVQLHALDVARRTLLKISDKSTKLTLVDKSLMMNGVNRYRLLMGAIESAMCNRYHSIVGLIDADMQDKSKVAPRSKPGEPQGGGVVIPMSRYRRDEHRRLVKT